MWRIQLASFLLKTLSNLSPKFQQCTGYAFSLVIDVCNWFLLVNVSLCQIQLLVSAFEAHWRKMRRVCVFKCFPGCNCQEIKKQSIFYQLKPTLHPLSKHGVSFRTAVSQSCGQPWPQTPFQQITDEAITTHDWWPVIQMTKEQCMRNLIGHWTGECVNEKSRKDKFRMSYLVCPSFLFPLFLMTASLELHELWLSCSPTWFKKDPKSILFFSQSKNIWASMQRVHILRFTVAS